MHEQLLSLADAGDFEEAAMLAEQHPKLLAEEDSYGERSCIFHHAIRSMSGTDAEYARTLCRLLVKAGIPPDTPDLVKSLRDQVSPFFTALDALSGSDLKDALSFLVELGADLSAAQRNGDPLLHRVAARGDVDLVCFLITELDVDPECTDSGCRTILDHAVVECHLDMVRTLEKLVPGLAGVADGNGRSLRMRYEGSAAVRYAAGSETAKQIAQILFPHCLPSSDGDSTKPSR